MLLTVATAIAFGMVLGLPPADDELDPAVKAFMAEFDIGVEGPLQARQRATLLARLNEMTEQAWSHETDQVILALGEVGDLATAKALVELPYLNPKVAPWNTNLTSAAKQIYKRATPSDHLYYASQLALRERDAGLDGQAAAANANIATSPTWLRAHGGRLLELGLTLLAGVVVGWTIRGRSTRKTVAGQNLS